MRFNLKKKTFERTMIRKKASIIEMMTNYFAEMYFIDGILLIKSTFCSLEISIFHM
jgi:hypothetical protein